MDGAGWPVLNFFPCKEEGHPPLSPLQTKLTIVGKKRNLQQGKSCLAIFGKSLGPPPLPPGWSFGTEIFFFLVLLRTALKDRPKGPSTANHQLPTANNRQLPTAANRQRRPTANRQPLLTAINHQSPTTNCRQPPSTATNRH